jgi:hypothetical protein
MKKQVTDWRDNGLIEGATIIGMITAITYILINYAK